MIFKHHGFKTWQNTFPTLHQKLGEKRSLSYWVRQVEKAAKTIPLEICGENAVNEFRGDAAEMLIEIVFKHMPYDNRIRILDYQPTEKNQYGVDGIGVGFNGHTAAVQIKSSTNSQAYLGMNQHHLGNFTTAACLTHYQVPQTTTKKDGNLLLIHFGKGLQPVSVNQPYLERVRQLTFKDLQKILDGNPIWEKIELSLISS